jgi:threonine dehydrogenase-like Zn-dependent dehydrogenase
VVIESAGRKETAEIAPKLARRGGTVLQFGVVSPDKMITLAPYDIFYRELKIVGSFVNPFTHARAVDMIASKQVDVLPLISHRFALMDVSEALSAAQSRDAVKVLILPQTG